MNAPLYPASSGVSSVSSLRLTQVTCYTRRHGEQQFRVSPVEVWLPPDSPLADDAMVVILGAQMPFQATTDGLYCLAEEIEHGRVDGPADRFDLARGDGEPWKGV